MSRKRENHAAKAPAGPGPIDFTPFEVTLIKALVLARQNKLEGLGWTESKAFARGRLTPNVLNRVAEKAGLAPDELVYRVYRAAGRMALGPGAAAAAPAVAKELAYRVWIQLSTRVVAVEINWGRDELTKVYDSWYACFQQVRLLAEEIPVWHDADQAAAKEVLNIVTEILNQSLRSHLTEWNSQYRHWAGRITPKDRKLGSLSPQQLQHHFPDFERLRLDFERSQKRLKDAAFRLQILVFPQRSQD